ISEQVDPEANIIFGAAFDPTLDGMIRVSVVATGMDGESIAAIEPQVERRPSSAPPLRASVSEPRAPAAPQPAEAPVLAAAEAPEEEQPDIFAAASAENQTAAEPPRADAA